MLRSRCLGQVIARAVNGAATSVSALTEDSISENLLYMAAVVQRQNA
jgi:hypothetical protein